MKGRRAKVVYSYVPQNEDELRLEVDEVIEVIEEVEEGWWRGRLRGEVGVFPSNFVLEVSSDSLKDDRNEQSSEKDTVGNDSTDGAGDKSTSAKDSTSELKPKPIKGVGFGNIFGPGGIKPILSPIDGANDKNKPGLLKKEQPVPVDSEPVPKLPPKPAREQAKVLFSYQAQNDDELSINEGDIINILSKEIEDQGWWKGELNGVVGVFPDNFVELIKFPEEPSRLKKPERPSEKPPPPMAGQTNQLKSGASKGDVNKSSNKSLDELPKASSGPSLAANAVPVIPGKKPKPTPSIYQQKPKVDPQSPSHSNSKPDVVPVENGSSVDKDHDSAGESFSSVETSKLTHLTANRAKGPPSRRPPSTIFLSNLENKENGEVVKETTTTNTAPEPTPVDKKSSVQEKPEKEKQEKIPPWRLELRKALAEKREKSTEEPPKEPSKPLSSPTKPTNRFSGDFGNKTAIMQSASVDTSEVTSNNPIQLLKPVKLSKPSVVPAASPSVTQSTAPTTPTTQPAKTTTNVVVNTTTSTPAAKVIDEPSSKLNAESNKELMELQKELAILKETTVSKKEYNELAKQVSELRELIESQKQSYGTVIKDLINDVAEERKKLATLQIEIDRLRKLTTTV